MHDLSLETPRWYLKECREEIPDWIRNGLCVIMEVECKKRYECLARLFQFGTDAIHGIVERCEHPDVAVFWYNRFFCSLITRCSELIRLMGEGKIKLDGTDFYGKKTLAVDFDGVIHRYSKGWLDGEIYDKPVEGAREALQKLSEDYRIVVFSARAKTPEGRKSIKKWLEKHKIPFDEITSNKPPAFAYIDDRAIRFESWGKTLKALETLREMEDAESKSKSRS